MANIARTPAEVIAGEAVHGTLQQRFNDMVHIASVMANRARLTGRNLTDVVSATSKRGVKQFSAYGKSLPDGTRNLVSLAERAIAMVEKNGPITPATYYATPAARTSLPPGLTDVGQTTGHVYAVDPENRAIGVGSGFVRPSVATRNPTNPMGGVSVAESRQNLPPDRQMPSGPIAPQRGPGLAALAPHGLPTGTLGNFDRTGLSSRLNSALNALNSDNSFSGIGVNSGYRDPSRNRKAGGAKQSQHIQGNAVDLDVSGMSPAQKSQLLDRALERGNFKGIGVYPSGNSLHIDVRRSPMAWGPSPAGVYSGIQNADGNPELSARELGMMPEWARPAISDMYGAGSFAVTPRMTAPTPTPRPDPKSLANVRSRSPGPASAGPALAAAMEKAGIRSRSPDPTAGVTRSPLGPASIAPDRAMPSGPMARPNLSAALQRAGITPPSPTQYAGRPASVASRVASATSAGSTVGVPGQTAPQSPTLGPAPTAPGDVTQTTIGPDGVQPGLIATGPIQTRPKVSVVAPTRVAPVAPRQIAPVQPRVVQPVQQPPQPVQPVQTPEPLGQEAFNARANPVTPGLRPSDVYNGQVGSALATGGNIVSRENSWGPTTVTNKYGVTTATMPDGKQAAVGSFSPFGGKASPHARSVIGGLAGGVLGALAGGPSGGLLGGLLGRSLATNGLGGLGGSRSQPGGGGGMAGGGLGGMLGGMLGGANAGNMRGGERAGAGGGAGGSTGPGTSSGGGGGRGGRRR